MECARAQHRHWLAANHEHVKAYRKATAERDKQRRLDNADRKREYDRKRYAAKSEEIKSRVRQYTADNAECVNARKRERYAANPAPAREYSIRNREKLRKRKAKDRAERPEHFAKLYREWSKNNPDKVRARDARKRALQKGATGSHTEAEWRAIVNRYDGRCVCCGIHCGFQGLTKDHIVPLNQGGTDYADNLQCLCKSCNSAKRDRHSTDYRKNPFKGKGQQRLF